MLKTCNKNKLNRADRPLRSSEKYFLSINKLFIPSRWLKEKKIIIFFWRIYCIGPFSVWTWVPKFRQTWLNITQLFWRKLLKVINVFSFRFGKGVPFILTTWNDWNWQVGSTRKSFKSHQRFYTISALLASTVEKGRDPASWTYFNSPLPRNALLFA